MVSYVKSISELSAKLSTFSEIAQLSANESYFEISQKQKDNFKSYAARLDILLGQLLTSIEYLSDQITSTYNDACNQIKDLKDDADTAHAALSYRIDNIVKPATTKISQLEASLAAEIKNRIDADRSLSNELTSNISTRCAVLSNSLTTVIKLSVDSLTKMIRDESNNIIRNHVNPINTAVNALSNDIIATNSNVFDLSSYVLDKCLRLDYIDDVQEVAGVVRFKNTAEGKIVSADIAKCALWDD